MSLEIKVFRKYLGARGKSIVQTILKSDDDSQVAVGETTSRRPVADVGSATTIG